MAIFGGLFGLSLDLSVDAITKSLPCTQVAATIALQTNQPFVVEAGNVDVATAPDGPGVQIGLHDIVVLGRDLLEDEERAIPVAEETLNDLLSKIRLIEEQVSDMLLSNGKAAAVEDEMNRSFQNKQELFSTSNGLGGTLGSVASEDKVEQSSIESGVTKPKAEESVETRTFSSRKETTSTTTITRTQTATITIAPRPVFTEDEIATMTPDYESDGVSPVSATEAQSTDDLIQGPFADNATSAEKVSRLVANTARVPLSPSAIDDSEASRLAPTTSEAIDIPLGTPGSDLIAPSTTTVWVSAEPQSATSFQTVMTPASFSDV